MDKIILAVSKIFAMGFFLISLAIPLALFFKSFWLQNIFSQFNSNPLIFDLIQVSLLQSLLSTIAASSLGLGFALILWRKIPLQSFAAFLLMIPFTAPSLLVATAWVTSFGRTGLFNQIFSIQFPIYSLLAIILAHTMINTPFMILSIIRACRNIPSSQIETARSLGANSVKVFSSILWPVIRLPFALTASQIFALCLTSFSIILLLGGGPPVETLETAIYSNIRTSSTNLSIAQMAVFCQIALSLPLWWITLYLSFKKSKMGYWQSEVQDSSDLRSRQTKYGFGVIVAVIFLIPFLIQLLSGLSAQKNLITEIFSKSLNASWLTSLQLSLATAILSLSSAVSWILICSFSKPNRRWNKTAKILAITGSLMSPLALSFSFWQAYSYWIDPFEGSFWAIAFIQSLLFSPFVFRWLLPISESRDQTSFEAALSLGASPFRAFLATEWLRWKLPLLACFLITFATSLGEVSTVSLFYSERIYPISLAIFRLMNQYRFDEAHLLSNLLFLVMVLSLSILWLSSKSRKLRSRSLD